MQGVWRKRAAYSRSVPSGESLQVGSSVQVSSSPCILFFDEIESVFKNRRKMESGSGVSEQILSQLLLQIDNVHHRNLRSDSDRQEFVFIIGATNLPEVSLMRWIDG